MLGVAGIAAVALAGCASSGSGTSSAGRPSSGMVIAALVGRERGGAGAFVRLTVKDHPYFFRVDTGAARTVVDATVAKALAFPARGAPYSAPTFGCKASAQPVAVSDWTLGDATLVAATVVSAKTVLAGAKLNCVPVGGLLGSDVLSHFGSVTLDFAGKRLILGGKALSGGRTIPMKLEHPKTGGIFVTVRATIRGKPARYVVDTGSTNSVIESRTSTPLGLQTVGKSLKAYGATGCSTTVTPVRINDWTAGGVKLPATIGVSARSSFIDKAVESNGIVGLLGANVLSTFGEVTIDFADNRMVLGGTTG